MGANRLSFATFPRASDYNDAWSKISKDLNAARSKVEEKSRVQQAYDNLLVAERQGIETTVAEAFARLAATDARSGSYREVVVQNFNAPVNGLSVDTIGGYATLPVLERIPIKLGNPKIDYDQSSSWGIPGDWAESQRVTNDVDGKLACILISGNDDTRAIVDGSAASSFEFETCTVNANQSVISNTPNGNAGGKPVRVKDYIAPDTWSISIPDKGGTFSIVRYTDTDARVNQLKLTVTIPVLDKDVSASQVTVTPYLNQNQVESSPFDLVKIEAVGSKGRTVLSKTLTMDRKRTVRIPEAKMDSVSLTFVQSIPYNTKLGHHYYMQHTAYQKVKKSWFTNKTKNWDTYTRLPNPSPTRALGQQDLVSDGTFIQNAGGAIGAMTQAAGGVMGQIPGREPVGAIVSGAGQAFQAIWSGLFGSSKTTSTVVGVVDGWDVFSGTRLAIGLSEVSLEEVSYVNTSSAVLGPFTFKQASRWISVHSTYQLPDEATDGVKIEVSKDQVQWSVANQDEVLDFPCSELWVRATLTRPEENKLVSPILNEIRVYAS